MSDPQEIFNAQKHAQEEAARRAQEEQEAADKHAQEMAERKARADEEAQREQQGRAWGDK
ncbi:hypothetical protein [Streptomyces tirandamycinicus]|uniref:Uncharacterized protein n=1 Tax=Streptomyces tirandamycinicus TaxID=2174846 RepID=A0A2S1SUQ3_9ACTN|nr:hypothetical protein [Streptomyces tirandamycinicus]AWI30121.1 hypothetical protein DDW44_16095 [Streptomyces tirandamycinicus]